ncbi:hypothetical protein B0T10DRAFT_558461 [Thelonectria olida]|uniref:Uncharacterized protein n=1 Tax=Thelonectria olida TaxID=1576542 RepID=A0A9P9ASC4_9HYPO|nr:hypothetical protein B0T10DRAFT_558461 [Thelonectria olida]
MATIIASRPRAILRTAIHMKSNDAHEFSVTSKQKSVAPTVVWAKQDLDFEMDLEEGEIREDPYDTHLPRPTFSDIKNKRRSYADVCDYRVTPRSVPFDPSNARDIPQNLPSRSGSVASGANIIPMNSETNSQSYPDNYRPSPSSRGDSSYDDRRSFCGYGNFSRNSRRESWSTASYSASAPDRSRNRMGRPKRRDSRLSEASFARSMQAYSDLSLGNPVQTWMRHTDRTWEFGDLKMGMIVSAPCHTQARWDLVDPADEHISFTEFGAVHSKYRKMLIVGDWNEHYDCLPLYSYNGRGLQDREDYADEYMHIRAVERDHGGFEENHEPLKATRDIHWPFTSGFINNCTVLKLTERISLQRTDKCSLEGHLTEASLARVKNALVMQEHTKVFGRVRL